jgi:hypothetical protein
MVPLANPTPVSQSLLALADPVTPTEVFRFAAPCARSLCPHFADEQCHLAQRVRRMLPVVSDELPYCTIRSECRWWQQEGQDACHRCPQVVTSNYYPSTVMVNVAGPQT